MKISYQRGIQKNFMIVDPEDLDWDSYECHMLLQNSIEGLLRMKLRPLEDGVRFYYDITSRQPLERMLKRAQWKAAEFRDLFIQICGILTRMQSYLLKEARILLDPEHIYMEPGSRRIFFCYVPGLNRPFSEDLGKLLEELLECVDHSDKECVVLAYGLYQETRKENYGVEDLLRQIYSRPVTEEEEKLCDYSFEMPEFPVEEASVREEKPTGFFEKFKDRLITRMPREEEEPEDTEDSWFSHLAEERPQEKMVIRERAVQPPKELSAGNTMVLADLGAKLNLRTLRALDPGVSDIHITYYPFVVGKQENLVDHRLDDDTVSRLHLKIDKKNDTYVIEDLNSTNGTTLNGELLENNEEREIVTGDEIGIARLHFRFE